MFLSPYFGRVSVLFMGGGVLRKVIAAICDEEEMYCNQLLKYLQGNQKENLEIAVYSDKKSLCEGLEAGKIEIVLMTEDFFAPEILNHPDVIFAVFCEELVSEEYSAYPHICKYQKIEEILRQLLGMAGERLEDRHVFYPGGKKTIAAFYSPHQDAMQMYLAMGYAKIRAETERVLYLNFMDCAGFAGLFGEEYREDMGDFLFYLRQEEKNLKLRFESMLHQFGEVSYLPPVFFGELLREAESSDYQRLLEWLQKETDYDVLVLDFGGMLSGFFEMLMQCKEIYCLTREEAGAKNRLKQFLQCAKEYGEASFLERIKVLPVTMQCTISSGNGGFMQELEWGEFGDYIRKQFTGGKGFE